MCSLYPGIRPERFSSCRGDCWRLMDACWHGDSTQRPLLGDVVDRLHEIHASDVDTYVPHWAGVNGKVGGVNGNPARSKGSAGSRSTSEEPTSSEGSDPDV